ncbi:LpxI family protein [Loktanella salsilacus]|uniref:LpxI family protein n=1 Tax=Loktanella salsilacus TaxID=195913 RepID=UPI0037355933
MLALIAGTGALPAMVLQALPQRPLVCALDGYAPDIPADITFRIERLGGFLNDLRARGVTQVCMVGGVRRPQIRASAFDFATLKLVPTIWRNMRKGDDGALRGFIALLEQRGLQVIGAHEAAPALLPPAGIPTQAQPLPSHIDDARAGVAQLALMGAADLGQACVIRQGTVIASEDDAGTDAMLAALGGAATAGILFKGPKPNQDRRADLPVIGPRTVQNAAAAGLAGIVIEAGGVMVPDLAGVIQQMDAQGLFLWVRPKEAA